uniref:Far11/STRP N-terminal domain-containing protein n=1 Tax=Strigamia maritima TaxID=126957 RepID=T1JAT6_STRMM
MEFNGAGCSPVPTILCTYGRNLNRRPRSDSDTMNDAPDIEFSYSDADDHLREIAELYSYTEENEFHQNRKAFEELMEEYGIGAKWCKMNETQQRRVISRLLDQLEISQRAIRIKALRSVLYLLQGVFAEVESEEEQQHWERTNVFLLYANGVFTICAELLSMEVKCENFLKKLWLNAAMCALRKPAVSLSDSTDLRIILNILYTFIEVMRCSRDSDTDEMKRTRELLRQKSEFSIMPIMALLFMITEFCSGTVPHFPIKKILLLLWKILLVSLGGMDELRELKTKNREEVGLPPIKEDTIEVTRTMRAASPPASAADLIEAQQQRNCTRPFRRSLTKQNSMDEAAFQDMEGEERPDDEIEEQQVFFIDEVQDERQGEFNQELSSRPSTPVPFKGLPWSPKVRQKDIDQFLDNTRRKFVGFPLRGDRTSLAGLPEPLHEGLRVLQQHVYMSLSEVQIRREEEIARNPLSQPEAEIKNSQSELLYQQMQPELPQYMIALLKILLAAAPTSKAKTDSINIMADVLPEEMPLTVLQSMKLGIDVNRHKEIIVKAVSGILLLLLKHFKLNHIYQFEFVSQHLVFANCIPLVLKFFNQNIMAYIQAKNTIAIIDFPSCVIGEQPELTAETLEIGDNVQFCWRNMFSCTNLLRILNKLTKWKHSRIMMLVVFKSAPILKRALKVKHAMMQLYILKLLKMQTKYLGRQWRKSNMKTMSAIYQKVRHRLNDDWAYGNDMDARPWDFQAEECALRACVDRFNSRRYDVANVTRNFDLEPVDNCILSVLGQSIDLSEEFKTHYEQWLHREVYSANIDWEQLLCRTLI